MQLLKTLFVGSLMIVGCSLLSGFNSGGTGTVLDGVLGGQMWDKWWIVTNLPEPTGDHPLYPPEGQKTGSTTWRCKECHGWDYKGVDGAYGSGSHFTGIGGVFGSTLTAEEMFDLIKLDTPPNGHGFGAAGLGDDEICQIVDFIQDYVIDTDSYIDGSGDFIGDVIDGRYNYAQVGGYYTCVQCHGEDGLTINFGTPEDPVGVGEVAVENPWELLHKIRFGQPGTTMPSWVLGGHSNQMAADVGLYAQLDFPLPEYVGDQMCSSCHGNMPSPGFFDAYRRSGHPYKLFRAGGVEPPPDTWPLTLPPPLPVVNGVQLEWSDIAYVIGNYRWKARFVDHDGFIYTGLADETTQWNLATEEWVPYHAGEVGKPYNCGKCHTTGYDPEGNQEGLPGLIGTWTEEGVRCEACHGPSGDHVGNPLEVTPPGGKTCAECHFRDTQFRMPWKGGFMRHHQQAEDFSHSPHVNGLTCNTCHDPHRSTVYDDGGLIASCSDCHEGDADNGFYQVAGMESVACMDCHMPHIGKNAVAVNAYKGDIRGHLFRVTSDPIFAVDNTYEVDGSTYWNQNPSFVTLDYACMGCHEEIGEPITMEAASQFAFHLHTAHPAGGTTCDGDTNGDGAVNVNDLNNVILDWGTDGLANGGDITGATPGSPPDGIVNVNDLNAVIVNWGVCGG